ncbi:hypothetical protein HHK36_017560 [Tetracentron sinense]|uniref:Uncharacterized protein n=1 Tax=Tetracentron sinense TaxID=13715 RepID=A0A835DFU4_TETSI|nr:hypothetical protein HHK36_017560 [Tetracentron sinense]
MASLIEFHPSFNNGNPSYYHKQMPYLDEWSALEEDYSSSLSGATKALQDASLRLPVVGNVRADILEVGEALNSASNVMGMMSYIGSFLPKAQETGILISELARVVGEERVLIEECGYLLSKTHMLQVDECSLRGHLIQLNRSSYCQPKEGQA